MPQFTGNQVSDWFSKFGVTATPEEMTAFTGIDYIGGGNAIADYILTKKNLAEQAANDPLKKAMEAEQTFGKAQQMAAQGYGKEADLLYGQLSDLMGQAPKLFGNLAPDQIDQFLAPLKSTYTAADAQAQTGSAARGIAGSSIEANARNDQSRIFKENVLNTGLNVGMTQQQLRQKMMQEEIARKSGLMTGANSNALNAFGLMNQSGGQLSQQGNENTLLMSSLPNYLRAQNLQEMAMRNAQVKKTPWGSIGSLVGMAGGAALAPFTAGMSIPTGMALGGALGGAAGGIAEGGTGTGAGSMAMLPWLMGSQNRPGPTPQITPMAPTGTAGEVPRVAMPYGYPGQQPMTALLAGGQ